jgi:hypothetical protein
VSSHFGLGQYRWYRAPSNSCTIGYAPAGHTAGVGRTAAGALSTVWCGAGSEEGARYTDPWARIDNFGPAFFTKLLYFTTPGALILDNVLAKKVNALSAMPYLVQTNGQSYAWSPYRYAVYLHWMRQTAAQLECSPDELELTLFSPQHLR